MLRCPGIPFLPGTTFKDPSKTRFGVSQYFMTMNGIKMLSDKKKVLNDERDIFELNCPPFDVPSLYPQSEGPKLPPWIVNDQKVLVFYAYFKETLQEVHQAPYQVRKVKIYFYLEDGTMKIIEPTIKNSGIPQGCLLSRQRVPRAPPCHKDFITVLDLNVNQTIRIFDRIYHITACDGFTRNFLNRSGIPVPDPVETPADPTFEMRNTYCPKNKIGDENKLAFAQFLKFDRQVLKFDAYWYDRTEFGDVRRFEICYYLADDTLEVKQRLPPNSGRDGPATFLKRQKVPKEWPGLPLPGQECPLTVLNVLGQSATSGRYVVDALGMGKRKVTYYKDNDLMIGAHLNIFGRDFVLTDCDPFTKTYYRAKYGIEEFKPLIIPSRVSDKADCPKEKPLPPYNGFGTHEDSEGNCKSVEPKRPHIDFKKFIFLDRFVLRFGAKMFSNISENCTRIFIVSYYLANDTVEVFEVAERNSGFTGGIFFKRMRVFLPNQNMFTSKRPDYYLPHHFYVGATLTIWDFVFHLVSADEYTLLYMENHPHQFPYACVETITRKVREALRPNYKNFVTKYIEEVVTSTKEGCTCCMISFNTLKKALIELLGNNINEHEIITLARYFSAEKEPTEICNRDTVRSIVHMEIRKSLWDELVRLKEHLYHVEPRRLQYIPEVKLRTLMLACRLPFSKELTDNLMLILKRNEEGLIDVCDFIDLIDVRNCPAPAIPPVNIAFTLCPIVPFQQRGRLVDWGRLLDKIGLEEDLKRETE